jgi:hypothetical protein
VSRPANPQRPRKEQPVKGYVTATRARQILRGSPFFLDYQYDDECGGPGFWHVMVKDKLVNDNTVAIQPFVILNPYKSVRAFQHDVKAATKKFYANRDWLRVFDK